MTMEKEMKTMWDFPKENPEQMSEEQTFQKELVAGVEKQLAESKEIMRNMIGRMRDEDVLELVELCLDDMEHRDYSMLIVCKNVDKEGSPFINKVVGSLLPIVSALMSLCIKSREFAKGLLIVAREYEAKREEFAEEEE